MTECVNCKKSLDESEKYHLLEKFGVQCCDHCASIIHAAYEAWHGGAVVESPKKYRKKKISPRLALSVYRRDGFICKSCGVSSNSDLTVDHVIPESFGGKTEIENLQTLCRSCNSKKGVKNAVV